MKSKLLVILGPTATGKTDLALILANKYNAELVAADSRQVYIGLDLGTGKAPGETAEIKKEPGCWYINGVPVFMYDIISPTLQYSVGEYVTGAKERILKISREKKIPIVVGGTGLYIKALLNGLTNIEAKNKHGLRAELEVADLKEVQKKLLNLSPAFFNGLNNSERNNKRRLIRKIEILSSPASNNNFIFEGLNKDFDVLKIGLSSNKQMLEAKIQARLDNRIRDGMLEEARSLHKRGLSFSRMRQLGLEYAVLADYLEGKIVSQNEFNQILFLKIRQYAKRQMTWFKKDSEIHWFDISTHDFLKKVESMVDGWYNN